MNFPSTEFDDAVATLCHGTIGDQALQELHELLHADTSARDEYLWRVELHGELASGRIDFQHLTPTEETTDANTAVVSGLSESASSPQRNVLLAIGVAATALIMLAVGLFARNQTDSTGAQVEVVAQFTELHDSRWMVATDRVEPGDTIAQEQRVELASGSAELQFSSGARMQVFGPTILQPLTGNSALLLMGQIQLVAETPESKGFTLLTPTTKFVDIGTAFHAAVGADGLSRLEVSEGEVDVALEGTEVVPRLRAGESLYVEPGERQVMTRIERGDGTAAFRFPTIQPPSREDYADRTRGNAAIRVAHGQLKSAAADVLLDGVAQSQQDAPLESAFFSSRHGGLLVDLGKVISISRINSYSWHQHEMIEEHRSRAQQRFTLYGFSGDELPDLTLPPDEAGWTRIARVNSDRFFEVRELLDRPSQQACSITGPDGDIGRFRYLLWEVRRGTFYGEIDVYGSPESETASSTKGE